KIRGFRMELGEIEAQLRQHPSVQLSVVIAKEIAGDKRLVAYIVPQTEPAPTISQLRDFLHQQLPEYMVPSYFVVLDAMPLTPNGKVDRRALPSPSGQLESHNFVAPRTPIEEMLAGIWASLLGIERVGVYDNFFELGGDSILTIQVVAKANQAGLQLTVKQLFERQTIAQLAAVVSAANQAEQGVMTGALPLTPIQHWFFEQNLPEPAHWNQTLLLEMQLGTEPNILEQVVQQLLVHHDALRLRFERINSGWQQKNAAVDDHIPFTRIDLSTLPEAQHKAVIQAKVAELQTSLNLSNGPVVRVAWLFLGDRLPSRLLIVIHHLAVDVVSWQILLSDLQTAYQQLSSGAAIQLPAKTTAFKHWAQRLTEYAQSQPLEKELGYWLTESYEQVASIPLDYPLGANTEASARTVSVSLSVEETRVLLEEVPKAYSTQIDDVLLTALVQVLAEWTGSNSILFNLESHGREHIFENLDLSRTVGWFSTIFPVVLELQATDNPGETLKSVKEQLRRVPQQGIGYGLLRYLKGDTEIAAKLEALPQAQVNFNYLGQFDQLLQTSSIFKILSESTEPSRSPIANRSHLLDVSGLILEGQLRLNWTYSEKVHLDSTVESLAHKFLQALQALIAHCLSPEVGGYTPSDFPVADLSQTDLDELIAQLQQEDLDY
ncbi:condensation domain-containing protein, partial [Tolypothrix sp. VBCCA 56010]|uniref:condensation domain-containing protein n=1 Tax=Tolypothrix sp. VBCCA 56010 TaxID=3137731 RepID=UPI003D7CFBFC